MLLLHFILPSKTQSLETISLKSLKGKEGFIQLKQGQKATVLFFLSPECPLCQSYSLTINQLQKTFGSQGFQFIGIIPGKDFTSADVIKYKTHYKLNALPFWFDPNLNLSKYCQANITPEVVVYKPTGEKVYQGRIDNWAYELARKRAVITEHDLQNVLSMMNSNQRFKPYKTKAVGCYIN
ncbi:MAG: redoxin domain-containing protein [bacterium]|nr:redoxin domain-containing protein [bacterium]